MFLVLFLSSMCVRLRTLSQSSVPRGNIPSIRQHTSPYVSVRQHTRASSSYPRGVCKHSLCMRTLRLYCCFTAAPEERRLSQRIRKLSVLYAYALLE